MWALLGTNLRTAPWLLQWWGWRKAAGLSLTLLLLLSLQIPPLWGFPQEKGRAALPRGGVGAIPAPEQGLVSAGRDFHLDRAGRPAGELLSHNCPQGHLPAIIAAPQLSKESFQHLSCRTQLLNNLGLQILMEPWAGTAGGSAGIAPAQARDVPTPQEKLQPHCSAAVPKSQAMKYSQLSSTFFKVLFCL